MPLRSYPLFRTLCLTLTLGFLFSGCSGVDKPSPPVSEPPPEETPASPPQAEEPAPYIIKTPVGATIGTRFAPPPGFSRLPAEEGSFGEYLRALPLNPDGDVIYLFDGTIKPDDKFDAVLKMEIGPRDFMRNTNFLIRLRGEYLYETGRFEDIEFHFLSGFLFPFGKWAEGGRINVNNNKVDWSAPAAAADDGPDTLKSYLNTLFIYSNATSIKSDLLQAVRVETGHVFLSHGGAVIADMAADRDGRTAVILVRGGDPEQEGYVVRNILDIEISPWFIVPENGIIKTPEGDLSIGDLYVFKK